MICLCVCVEPAYPQILQESTALQIIGHFSGDYADLVVCDGAPDGNDYFNSIYHIIVGWHSLCVCVHDAESIDLLILFIVTIKQGIIINCSNTLLLISSNRHVFLLFHCYTTSCNHVMKYYKIVVPSIMCMLMGDWPLTHMYGMQGRV